MASVPNSLAAMDEDQISTYLTEDIVVEILLRLPVKPLFKFKCVSKRCKSIICDPAFAQKYLQRAYSSPELSSSSGLVVSLLFPFTHLYRENLSKNIQDLTHTINSSAQLSHDDDDELSISVSRLAVPNIDDRWILASSNGLVLTLFNTRYSHVGAFVLNVCNPLTKKSVPLPKSTLINSNELLFGIATKKCAFLTYKVVAVRYVYKDVGPQDYASTIVEIFSSVTGSWVALEVRCCPGEVFDNTIPKGGLTYKGALHWLSRKTRTVITYDPYYSPRRFGHIRLPHQRGSCRHGSLIYSGDEEMLKYCEIDKGEGVDRVSVWRLVVKSDGNGEWCNEGRFEVPPLHHRCWKVMVAPYPWNRQIICHPYVRGDKLTIINPLTGRRTFVSVFEGTTQPFLFRHQRCGLHYRYPLIPIQLCPWSSPSYAHCNGALL